jgi:hypothetical protein
MENPFNSTKMERPIKVDVSEKVFNTVLKAIQGKKEWIRKVQEGQITYKKGKRIA